MPRSKNTRTRTRTGTRTSRRRPELNDFFLETVPYFKRAARVNAGRRLFSREYRGHQKRGYSLPEFSGKQNTQKVDINRFKFPPIRNFNEPVFTIPCPTFKFTKGYVFSQDIPLAKENCFISVTKDNQFSFEVRHLDQFWSAIRARNLTNNDQTLNHVIPVPNFWNTPGGPQPMGFVSQTTDQQGYIELPGYEGMGVTFDRHINVLFHRRFDLIKAEYAIMKFGVRSDSNGLIFIPMYQFGFENMLLNGSQFPYPKLQQLHDIESLPNYTYLVGTVKDSEKNTVQIFRVEIQTGEVKTFIIEDHGVDFSKPISDSTNIKIAVDHTLFRKTSMVRLIVMINDHIIVLQENDSEDLEIAKARYALPVSDSNKNEWQDVAANCGNLFTSRKTNPASPQLSQFKSDDLAIFDYLTGKLRDTLLKNINYNGPKINGFGLTNPTGGGMFMEPPMRGILAGLNPSDSKVKLAHFKVEAD